MMQFGRRRFIKKLAAAATGACLCGSWRIAGAASDVRPASRIDIHHHALSPRYIAEARAHRSFPPATLAWTPARSLEDMDRGGVAKAMLSIPTPGVYFGDIEATRKLARHCNEYAAQLVRDYPGRFGLFAVLPLPDIDASLREIAYAYDTLGADGVGVYSSYGRRWLGDPFFAPLFEELERRKALLFTHAILNDCCENFVPGVADTLIEYGTDTTRTIASLIFSGAAARYPNVRIVFSHAGGTMPFLIERFVEYGKLPAVAAHLPNSVQYEIEKFYYDTAWVTNPASMAALLKVVPVPHVVFGTDYPALTAQFQVDGLAGCAIASDDLAAIYRSNAVKLIPRLA